MNCQPGDLAIVVRTIDGHLPELLGQIFRVTALSPLEPHIPTWAYEGERRIVFWNGIRCTMNAVPDSMLQPIRDVPDTDEVTTDRTIDEGVAA